MVPATHRAALENTREAVELYLETLSPDERYGSLSREIVATSVEVEVT